MSKETVAEFIAASKELRRQLTNKTAVQDEYRSLEAIRYNRITKIYCVLTPLDYEWRRETIDIYSIEDWDELVKPLIVKGTTSYYTIVSHGHPVGLTCFAPNFCHVEEYSPVGNESPIFLKAWKDKWG